MHFDSVFDILQTAKAQKDETAILLQSQQNTPLIVHEIIQRKIHFRIYEEYINEIKQTSKSFDPEDIKFYATYRTIQYILGPNCVEEEIKNLSRTNQPLTPIQRQILEMFFDLSTTSPDNLIIFLLERDIFSSFFKIKDGNYFLSRINQIYRNNPIDLIGLACHALKKVQRHTGFQQNIAARIDHWLARQLAITNFKTENKNPEFQELILEYLIDSAQEESEVAAIVFKNCDSFEFKMQNDLWKILYSYFPSDKKRALIYNFIDSDSKHTTEANELFYINFISHLDSDQRAKILGCASNQQQQSYARLVENIHLPITDIKIKTPQSNHETYLVWQLLETGGINQTKVSDLIQKAPLLNCNILPSNAFLFQDKEHFDSDIFMTGYQKMKFSTSLLFRWIASFKKSPQNGILIWSTLPDSSRYNENMALFLDRKFDLIYQAALQGNTMIINDVKHHLKHKDFKKSLMRSHDNGETALHALFRKEKRPILDLLKSFDSTERQELLNLKNNEGKTPLDCCSTKFRYFIENGTYTLPKQPPKEDEKKKQPEPPTTEKNETPTEKQRYRCVFLTKSFIRDLKQAPPEVIKAASKQLEELRSMSDLELSGRATQHGKRHVNGKPSAENLLDAYRLVYIVEKSCLVVFFLRDHPTYERTLNSIRSEIASTRDILEKNLQPGNTPENLTELDKPLCDFLKKPEPLNKPKPPTCIGKQSPLDFLDQQAFDGNERKS